MNKQQRLYIFSIIQNQIVKAGKDCTDRQKCEYELTTTIKTFPSVVSKEMLTQSVYYDSLRNRYIKVADILMK